MGTYEEWLAKKREERAAGNSSGSSGSPQSAQSAYEAWVAKKSGKDATDWWGKSGIEAMDRDFQAFAKDERRWLEQGAFSRQYSSNAERWRGNIAQERAWLDKYGARLGDNAQRISDALDGYEDTLNYYDSLYAATEEYEKAGQKISDYITAGVDPAQIDMEGLLQNKANVSSGATVVLATDQYSKEQEQLMQSFQPFTTGTAMDKDNQAVLGKEVSGQRARTKMALAWLDQHQNELGEETYQGLKGYYDNTLTQLDLMDSTIQWYADGKSAAVYQDMGNMIQAFQKGEAPTAELAQQEESLYAEVQELQEQVDTWQQQYDDMREAINEGRISEKNLQAAQENLQWSRDNLRGYQQLLAQKEQELREVQERSDFYWILAMSSAQEDGAEEKTEEGKEKYERIYGLWEQAVNNSPEAVGYEKKYLTFENEKEYENAVENYLVNGVKLQDKKVLPNGRIQATIYTENYTQDLTPARARERKNFPLAIDTEHLTEEEKNTFYYLVGAGYDSMAIDYVQSMAIERRKERMQKIEEWAGQNIGTQMLALVQQSLLFPVAGRDLLSSQSYEQDTGLRANPTLGPAAIKDSLNSGVVKAWDQWSGTLPNDIPVLGGKGLGSVYQMGVSIGESYGSGAAFGPAATIFMGMSAASSAYNNAIMNGATQEKAELQGAAQGVAEALFEKISVEHWLGGKDYGSIVKNALVQGGIEASEEMLTSVTNAITDRLIMQDKSAFNTAVQSYIDQGYSKEDAEDKAWRELLEEIAFDSVSGFITGGVMGGGSSAVNYISTGKTAQQILNGVNSSSLEELQDYYAAQLAAGVQEADTAQEQKRKISAWLRQGGEYTNEQLQQARSMAEDKINGREVVYPAAKEEAKPEYTGQRYEMAAEEIIDNARAMATEGFTGLGMSQREAEQIANNLERAIRTGEITDKRIDQMQPTDTGYLAVIEDALNVEIPQAKGIAQARANVRAAIEAARARYLGEATAPAIEIGQEQAEQLRSMSDEELQLQLELERETRDDTSAQPIVRQQAQQALDVLEQEYQRRNGGVKNVQQQEQAAPAPAEKQGRQAERGAQVRNAEPQRNDRVGAGEQGGTVPKRDTAQVEQGRQGTNDQGDRGKSVRKKRDLSRFENIAKTKSTRDYLGKAGAEEVTLGEVTEEYWTDEMRQAAEKAEAAGLTVHYVVGSILRANGERGGGGVYYRGTILASVNDVRFLPEQLVEHEMYHADATQEATEEILAAIREKYSEAEFERIVRDYAEEYEGIIAEDDVQALYEEIAADAAGGMNRFAETGKVAESREQAQEIISRKGREAQRGDRARAPPAEAKYSTEADDAAYMEAVEAGDMETAQRMVDEAAQKAGYTNSEDWRMDHRAPTAKDDTAHSIDQIDKAYGNDGSIYSPQAVYYYGEYRSYDRKAINVIRMAKNNPEKMITVYRAVPLDVKDTRMRNGDWVAIVREYAEEHGERMFDEGYRIIENRVPAKHIYGNGDSVNEWGYDNGDTKEVYKNAVGNVKLAAVTYDNDGNVIPLSERFDPEQEDIRWSADIEAAEDEDAKRPWEIVSDEQHAAAREMGYPVLDGEQVIPFRTWVQATDIDPDTGEPRNNYGLVVSNSVATRQLGVNFWNKNAANGNRTEGNAEFRYVQYQDLHPVQGQYQMTDAEYTSLMESVPEDVAREQIDFMGDNAAEFSKMYEEILWQREQQRLRDEENGLKLDEAPEGFPWSKKKPLRSSGTRLSPREAAKYLAGATGKEWNIIQDPRRGTWKAVPSARPAGVAKDSEYNRLVKEAKEAGETPMSWKEFSWQKLQENAIKYGEEISTRPVRPEGIARAEFQGTQALRDLGIRISGSVVDYSDTATMRERELALRKMHKSIKKMERALRKNEGAAQLGSRTIAMAEDLAAGKIFPEDIPKTLDRRDVIKLAELKMDYKLLGEDLSKKRKLAINRGLVEKAMEMLPDAKELAGDPEAVKAVSLLLLNYGTPEDNMYQIFGDKNGRAEKLYDYYFRTVEENEAEKMRWMNRMFDEASAFRDSKGKQSRLNKAESAYVHVLLDMEGVVQNVENSKRAKEIKALAEATNRKNTEEAEKIGATLNSVEKEWAEQYARFVAEQAAAKANKKIDQTKCENAAQHYRENFEKLYQALTDLMVTHGLTPLGHIDYYAPHLTINEKSNIMAGFFQELGLKSADGDITEIPADIAGRTQEFKPTKRWTPFLLKRKGTATDYDIVTAYETYLTYVADVLYHHDDILKLRGLETMLRNTANAEWQEQMKELLRVSAYGDINDKVELLQQMGVIDQDYEGEMSPEELLRWLDKNASVEEKHKYLVELGQLMPEEVVTEEQIHALFSELGTQQDEAFAAAVQGLLEDYGLMDGEKKVTVADATDKLNELYEAMASEKRRSEAVRYSNLVGWITNYTNILAGKQYGGDRGAEYNGGRKLVKALSNTVRRYGTAKVVGNLSSVLSQVSQVPMIMAETSAKSQIMALRDIMSQITKENRVQMRGWGDQVDLLTGKKGVQYINTSVGEKITIPMVKLLEIVDRFVSLYAARSAYYDALNGKVRGIAANDQNAATRYANDFARRIMASRAKGSKPAAFHSKGFFSTMLNMFQVEQLNTVRHMLHDMPRDMRRDIREYGVKKGVARYASKMMVYMLAAFLLNRGLDEVYGQTPIPFDVPGYILQFIAAGYGVTANDLLTGQGELKDEFQWGDAIGELGYEALGDVPLVNNALGILGLAEQKMPMPDVSTIVDVFQSVWKAMTDEGVSGWVAAEAAAKALAEFIPGGSQIKKTVGGISALARGGTYTDDGRLKWAVDNDPWSVIQNILFGTSSTDEAQRYYARGYGAVSENLTEAYKLLTEQGIDPDDAYDAVYGVKMAWDANEDLSYEEKKQLQRDAIQNSGLDDNDKLLLWTYAFGYKDDETGEIVNKDAETFLQLMEADMSWDDIMEMYNHRQELEEDDTLDDEAADLQFAHWVETHGYTKEQKAVIVDAYASGEDRYFKLADCGIGASNAKALEEAFTAFSKSLDEGKSITTTDKAKIVIEMGMSDADEYRALAVILKSGTLDRLTVATNAGITCSTWIEYWTATAQMQNIKDENDEIVMQKKDQVLAYIDGLPLTPEQKNVLYYDQGYAESKIGEAPWN